MKKNSWRISRSKTGWLICIRKLRTAYEEGINRGKSQMSSELSRGVDIKYSGQVLELRETLWVKGIGKEDIKKLLWILKWISFLKKIFFERLKILRFELLLTYLFFFFFEVRLVSYMWCHSSTGLMEAEHLFR